MFGITFDQQLAALRRARYGCSSEKLDEHIYQLELMLEDLRASVSEERSTDPTSTKGSASADEEQAARLPTNRQSLPPQLPREHQRYELGDICECCGSALVEFVNALEYVYPVPGSLPDAYDPFQTAVESTSKRQ